MNLITPRKERSKAALHCVALRRDGDEGGGSARRARAKEKEEESKRDAVAL